MTETRKNDIGCSKTILDALNRINEWCCYASEEDIDARPMALQQIGILARAAIAEAARSTAVVDAQPIQI